MDIAFKISFQSSKLIVSLWKPAQIGFQTTHIHTRLGHF